MGIFNSDIFNNDVFNTGGVAPVIITRRVGGDDAPRKKRKKERESEESRRAMLAALFSHRDELPAPELAQVEAVIERFADPVADNKPGIDYAALLAQASLTTHLIEIERRRIAEEFEEDAIFASSQ